jgi:hypothetical protein
MECAETKDQAPDKVGASEFRTQGMGIFTDTGSRKKKRSETRTTLAHSAKLCLGMVLRKSLELLVAS